jgi:hypothetical protein
MTIDAFEELFNAQQAAPQPAAARTYAVAPQGIADVEIVAASIGDVAWKASDANPAGTCLKLRLSAGREHSFIFADLPRDKSFVFKALAAALGIAPGADGKVSIGPVEALVGRHVRIEVGHYQTKTGEQRACVRKWLPPVAAQPATKPIPATATKPAATAARTSKPQWECADDIPF